MVTYMNIVHKVNQNLIFFGNLIYICPERLLFRPCSESLNIDNTESLTTQDDLDWDTISLWFNRYMLGVEEDEYNEKSYFDFVFNDIEELKNLYQEYLSSNDNHEIRNKDFSIAELLQLSDKKSVESIGSSDSIDYHSFSLVAMGTKSVVTQNNILDIIHEIYNDKHFLIFLLMNPNFLNRIPDSEFDRLFFSLDFKYSDMMYLLENEYFSSHITEYHLSKIINWYLPSMDNYIASCYFDDILTAISNNQTLFSKLQEYHIKRLLDTVSSIDIDKFEAGRILKSKVFSVLSDSTLDYYLLSMKDGTDRLILDSSYITLLCCNTYLKDYFSRLNESKLVYLFETVINFFDRELFGSSSEQTFICVQNIFECLQITTLLSYNQILSCLHVIRNPKLVDLIINYIGNRYSDD